MSTLRRSSDGACCERAGAGWPHAATMRTRAGMRRAATQSAQSFARQCGRDHRLSSRAARCRRVRRWISSKVSADGFLELANHTIYLRLMIDGAPSQPFSAMTLRPSEVPARRDPW